MPKKVIYRIYSISFLATLCLLSVYIYLNHHYDGSIWQTLQPSKSALTGEYCEQDNVTHFFRQRMNTYSNLLYCFLGMLVVLIAYHDKKERTGNQLQQFPLLSFFFGCCLIYLCFGSSFFHASLTWVGQRVDMNGTYSVCISLVAITYYRLFSSRIPSANFQRVFVGLLVLLVLFFIELHLWVSSLFLLPAMIMLIITGTVINYTKRKTAYRLQSALLSLMLMLAAAMLRSVDVQKIACDPTSLCQGHSLWHFFTGMSAFLLYWFYRSEKV